MSVEKRRRFDVAGFDVCDAAIANVRMNAVRKRRQRTVGGRSVRILFDVLFVLVVSIFPIVVFVVVFIIVEVFFRRRVRKTIVRIQVASSPFPRRQRKIAIE